MSTIADKPGWRQILTSILAAIIGVQSNKNRHRDFKNASIKQFLIMGFIVVIIFIFAIYLLVQGTVYWLK